MEIGSSSPSIVTQVTMKKTSFVEHGVQFVVLVPMTPEG